MSAVHPSVEALVAYVSAPGPGAPTLDHAALVAIDGHLLACPLCRGRVNDEAAQRDAARLAASWELVAGEALAPPPALVERLLRRVGVPEWPTRVLVATPALRRSWYLAVFAALLVGIAAASPNRPDASVLTFLTLVPLVPVAGVALAYGRGADPSYEVTLATPSSGVRLVLARAVAVVAVSIAVAALATVLLPPDTRLAAAWLVPALALAGTALALSSWVRPRVAGLTVAAGWLTLVNLVARAGTDELALFGLAGQAALAAGGAAAWALVVARRRAFEVMESGS